MEIHLNLIFVVYVPYTICLSMAKRMLFLMFELDYDLQYFKKVLETELIFKENGTQKSTNHVIGENIMIKRNM